MELLGKIVGIRSYSGEETELSEFVSSYFKYHGHDVYERNGNVIVHIKKNSRNCLIFNAHMDTVRVQENWETNPFELTRKDDRYYGLGVSDEKVSVAILMEIADLIRDDPDICSDVMLAFVVKEEVDGSGSKDFIEFFVNNFRFDKSACIICEPRNAKHLGVGCKGSIFFRATFNGVASHSSSPEKGDNAILKAFHASFDIPSGGDLLGRTTIAYPTLIEGGSSMNTVPDKCVAYGNIRTNTLTHDILLNQLKKSDNIEIVSEAMPFIARYGGLIDAFARLGITEQTTTNGSNDAVHFGKAGIPVVVFGAGNEECCHVSNEYVDIGNIEKTKEIYLRLCREYVFD